MRTLIIGALAEPLIRLAPSLLFIKRTDEIMSAQSELPGCPFRSALNHQLINDFINYRLLLLLLLALALSMSLSLL